MKKKVYMVVCDLLQPEHDYSGLEAELKAYGKDRKKILHSAWLVKSNESAEEILAKFSPFLADKDRCAVFEVARANWSARLPDFLTKVTLWMAY